MAEPKNVQFTYQDFKLMLDVFEQLDFYNYADDFRTQLETVKDILQDKKHKLETREAYTKLVIAKDEDTRHDARMNYLQKKNQSKFEL